LMPWLTLYITSLVCWAVAFTLIETSKDKRPVL
jgi:hypothetical protein